MQLGAGELPEFNADDGDIPIAEPFVGELSPNELAETGVPPRVSGRSSKRLRAVRAPPKGPEDFGEGRPHYRGRLYQRWWPLNLGSALRFSAVERLPVSAKKSWVSFSAN
jgi:hypothetical protein